MWGGARPGPTGRAGGWAERARAGCVWCKGITVRVFDVWNGAARGPYSVYLTGTCTAVRVRCIVAMLFSIRTNALYLSQRLPLEDPTLYTMTLRWSLGGEAPSFGRGAPVNIGIHSLLSYTQPPLLHGGFHRAASSRAQLRTPLHSIHDEVEDVTVEQGEHRHAPQPLVRPPSCRSAQTEHVLGVSPYTSRTCPR